MKETNRRIKWEGGGEGTRTRESGAVFIKALSLSATFSLSYNFLVKSYSPMFLGNS